ncbi:MAG TPA: hypothetical protein VED63_05835 [Acidimicrobiales bacterium]|nr:hypothetical protein [Acidimicrobiales bacterium]
MAVEVRILRGDGWRDDLRFVEFFILLLLARLIVRLALAMLKPVGEPLTGHRGARDATPAGRQPERRDLPSVRVGEYGGRGQRAA